MDYALCVPHMHQILCASDANVNVLSKPPELRPSTCESRLHLVWDLVAELYLVGFDVSAKRSFILFCILGCNVYHGERLLHNLGSGANQMNT